ncbi:hypothetical protein AFLA_013761 [Aspergillus flavus NRRL3357]|nr:hypothetical protein AFLA_013761 [Aspergillus flavus NRRL3357]
MALLHQQGNDSARSSAAALRNHRLPGDTSTGSVVYIRHEACRNLDTAERSETGLACCLANRNAGTSHCSLAKV